jgi:D-alanine-D-alanine ligase-like ATP-grasp enzyme
VEIIEKYKNFCIIGLDIMLDDAGKPYILEMNS